MKICEYLCLLQSMECRCPVNYEGLWMPVNWFARMDEDARRKGVKKVNSIHHEAYLPLFLFLSSRWTVSSCDLMIVLMKACPESRVQARWVEKEKKDKWTVSFSVILLSRGLSDANLSRDFFLFSPFACAVINQWHVSFTRTVIFRAQHRCLCLCCSASPERGKKCETKNSNK